MIIRFVLIVHFLLLSAIAGDNKDEEKEVFEATNDWKAVKKGQSIPAGLHVRMNLATGQTEAKLLDKEDSDRRPQNTAVSAVPGTQQDEVEDKAKEEVKIINLEEYKKALKSLSESPINTSEEEVDYARSTYRSFDEIKKEFFDLKLTVKTNIELMIELVNKFKTSFSDPSSTEDDRLIILKDLEYLVHHIDNARDFVKIGGINEVVYPSLNMSSPSIRARAIELLGSAAQSNPHVQIFILNGGGVNKVLKILALDDDYVVRTRALYALSCMIRRFPAAQHKMITEGGLSVLSKLFKSEQQEDLKLQVKAITLLHDLVLEKIDAQNAVNAVEIPDAELVEKLKQYETVGLEFKLLEQGWCRRIPELLILQNKSRSKSKRRDDFSSAAVKSIPASFEHDIVEKITSAMFVLTDVCWKEFNNNKELRAVLLELREWYKELASREQIEGDEEDNYLYYSLLFELIKGLTKKLHFEYDKETLHLVYPKTEL